MQFGGIETVDGPFVAIPFHQQTHSYYSALDESTAYGPPPFSYSQCRYYNLSLPAQQSYSSTKHRCPLTDERNPHSISISASDIPSLVETRA